MSNEEEKLTALQRCFHSSCLFVLLAAAIICYSQVPLGYPAQTFFSKLTISQVRREFLSLS